MPTSLPWRRFAETARFWRRWEKPTIARAGRKLVSVGCRLGSRASLKRVVVPSQGRIAQSVLNKLTSIVVSFTHER